MPAKKPISLHNGHATRGEKSARIAREEALAPENGLQMRVPSRLFGHEVAAECWRRAMKAYSQVEATVVTQMDMDLLVDYCILTEQVTELDELRKASFASWKKLNDGWAQVEKEVFGKDLLQAVIALNNAFTDVVKLDGRVDRKRALLLQWRQSLYLTPRARAGVAPAKKEKEEAPDPMDQLLGKVTEFVNRSDDAQ